MTRSIASIKCFKANTSDFPENFLAFGKNFPAFSKNFLAFVENFLAFQQTSQAGLRRFGLDDKHSTDFGVEIDRDLGVARVWVVV